MQAGTRPKAEKFAAKHTKTGKHTQNNRQPHNKGDSSESLVKKHRGKHLQRQGKPSFVHFIRISWFGDLLGQFGFHHWQQPRVVVDRKMQIKDQLHRSQVALDPRNNGIAPSWDEVPILMHSANKVTTQIHIQKQQPGEHWITF
jgi:hypothetical protein